MSPTIEKIHYQRPLVMMTSMSSWSAPGFRQKKNGHVNRLFKIKLKN